MCILGVYHNNASVVHLCISNVLYHIMVYTTNFLIIQLEKSCLYHALSCLSVVLLKTIILLYTVQWHNYTDAFN